MAASRGQKSTLVTRNNQTSGTTTFGTNPTAGQKVLLGIFVFDDVGAPTSITDNSAGSANTWTQDKATTDAGANASAYIYRCDNVVLPAAAALLAITVNFGAGRFFSAIAQAYDGVATGAPTNGGGANATNSKASGSATTSADTNAAGGASTVLHFAVLADSQASGTATITAGSGFTEVGAETNASASFAGEVSDKINSGAADTCTWSITNAPYLAVIVAYSGAATGATVTPAAIACTVAAPQAAVSVAAAPAVTAGVVAAPAAHPAIGVTPAPAAAVASLPQPTVVTDFAVTEAVIQAVVALPAATPLYDFAVTPATLAAVVALPQPAVSVAVAETVLAAVVALATPTAGEAGGGDATATPAALAAVGALPQPAVSVGASPAPVAGVVSVPQPAVAVSVAEVVLAVVVALPQASPGVSATITPAHQCTRGRTRSQP